MKNIYILAALMLFSAGIEAQISTLTGKITGTTIENGSKEALPLFQANIHWIGTTTGVTSDENGDFSLDRVASTNNLVVSFIGYRTDTLVVPESQKHVEVTLNPMEGLDEVTVVDRQKGSYILRIAAIQTETVTSEGLQKLPCCNLAESFENTATVDVGYADAVSGARQIKMLGLAGKYSQILVEKKPAVRGLSSNFGISYIPGTWMESIQVSKGTSSVTEGYESISGQINVEYKKPDKAAPLHVNIYGNSLGKGEANIVTGRKLNENWSTLLLFAGGHNNLEHDMNDDGFLDLPLNTQVHVMNRWKYDSNKNYRGQFGFVFLDEDRTGGQKGFKNSDVHQNSLYGIGIKTRRYEVFGKNGFRLANPNQSIGIIANVSRHEVESFYGTRTYKGEQTSLYLNAIFRTRFLTCNQNLSTGISFQYDDYAEEFEGVDYLREEYVPGVFAEYNFNNKENFNLIAGVRYDHHNQHGGFLTPRLHAKYNINWATIIRASLGKGYKVASIFSENPGLFASSRQLNFVEDLEMEEAWNMGINLTHEFMFLHDVASLSIDFYRTQFVNQVVVDMDQDLHNVYFYNLDGESFANSFQAEISTEPFERLEVTAAFRYNDVKVTIADDLKAKPFVNKVKALATASYATKHNKWKFDVNLQYNGKGRLPEVLNEVEGLEHTEYSPDFYMLQAQITRKFKHFSVYAGGENLTDFVQDNPIIGADSPFGSNFDASMVWGPIVGRRFFLGVRYTLK